MVVVKTLSQRQAVALSVAKVKKRARTSGAVSKRDGAACSTCASVHPGCTGHKRTEDGFRPCAAAPIRGGDVCVGHGGRAPQVVKKAMERRAIAEVEGRVAEALREADLPDQHPIDGLLDLVRRSSALVAVLGNEVARLDLELSIDWYEDDEGKRHYISKGDSIYGLDHNSDQAPHVLYTMYLKERDHFARVCKLALDANIDERMVRNAERQGQVVLDAFKKTLVDASVPQELVTTITVAFAKNLRGLSDPLSALNNGGGARGRAS